MSVPIEGFTAPGFETVRDVFARHFSHRIEVGASFSVVHRGETVVDLWGGFQDRDRSRPWREDTLVNVYSTTKGMGTLAAAIAVQDGCFAYDDPVTRYWPEFGAHGKDVVNIAQLLSHQAGVCGLRQPLQVSDLYDWDKMVTLLAQEEPHWPPGTGAGYHAVTWGYLPGELIRRTAGVTLGELVRDRVARPLGADFHIGLPEAEHHRVADMIGPNHARLPDGSKPQPGPMVAPPPLFRVALQNPGIRPFQDASSAAWRSAEIAAANGQANARGIARIYGALALGGELDGVRVIDEQVLQQSTRIEVGDKDDLVVGRPMIRARGWIMNTEGGYGPNPHSFGHGGAGGSTGFADPDQQLGIGYAMNQMQVNPLDSHAARLVAAVYDGLKQ